MPRTDVQEFIAAVKLIEDAGWSVIHPKKLPFAVGQTGKIERFHVQHWDCELSPIGKCIGDAETDEDECVFCGNPEERK